jgi:hypothetical protein
MLGTLTDKSGRTRPRCHTHHDRPSRALTTKDHLACKADPRLTEVTCVLRQLLKSKSEYVRLKAAEAQLAHGREQTGLAELQAEVEELKAARAPQRNGRVAWEVVRHCGARSSGSS